MATVDLTRKRNYAQKKTLSVSAVKLTHTELTSSSDEYVLFTVPANSVLSNVKLITNQACSTAGTTVTVKFDGTAILSNKAVTTAGNVETSVSDKLSGTGADVSITINKNNITDGEFIVIFEYTEFDLATGNTTRYYEA